MGRPRKHPESVMGVDLRVPMTPDQKAIVMEAAQLEQMDMAAWVRPILIQAAKERIAREKAMRSRGDSGRGPNLELDETP